MKSKEENCPDYFMYDGKAYKCVGNDNNQFWVEIDGGSKGFEQSNCTALYPKSEYIASSFINGTPVLINGELCTVDHIKPHDFSNTVKDGFCVVFENPETGIIETEPSDIIKILVSKNASQFSSSQPCEAELSERDLVLLAGRTFPIYEEQDFDDTYMDYDEYVRGQNEQREAFISGYKKATLSRTTLPAEKDYEEVIADHKRLVRELDVIINGDNAAQQASLCDIVAQLRSSPLPPIAEEKVSEGCVVHSTDWNGKCFKCGQQLFTREEQK